MANEKLSYSSEWQGSTVLPIKSGYAHYRFGETAFAMHLDNFGDFTTINTMLELAFKQGKVFAEEKIQERIVAVLMDAT